MVDDIELRDTDYYGERVNSMAVESSRGAPADTLIPELLKDQRELNNVVRSRQLSETQRALAGSVLGYQSVLIASQYCRKSDYDWSRKHSEYAFEQGEYIKSSTLKAQALSMGAINELHYGTPEVGRSWGLHGLNIIQNTNDAALQAMMHVAVMICAAKMGDETGMRDAEQSVLRLQQTMEEPRFLSAFTLSPRQLYNALGLAHEAIGSKDAVLYYASGEAEMRPRDPADTTGLAFRRFLRFGTIRCLAQHEPKLAINETANEIRDIAKASNGRVDQIYQDRAVMVLNRLPVEYRKEGHEDGVTALLRQYSQSDESR